MAKKPTTIEISNKLGNHVSNTSMITASSKFAEIIAESNKISKYLESIKSVIDEHSKLGEFIEHIQISNASIRKLVEKLQ